MLFYSRAVTLVARFRSRLGAVVRRGAVEREMLDEMTLHLDRATERLMRRGMTEDEARAAARREFGNVAVLQEEARDARGGRWAVGRVGRGPSRVRQWSSM